MKERKIELMETKVIAMYLPQYHRIVENDMWWGKGYTDWVAVKKSLPLFPGHNQPRVPYKEVYYDLAKKDVIKGQAEMAKKYGIYGFGIYHYWFSEDMVLLDKPAFILKDNRDIDIKYFFMWDNGSWKRTWSNVKFSNSWAPLYENSKEGPEILAQLQYGGEKEWKSHFDYLYDFFADERYIKIDGKPVFGIFNQNNEAETLKKMFEFWNECAIKAGLPGIIILGRKNVENKNIADYIFDYEPATHGWGGKNYLQKICMRIKDKSREKVGKLKTYEYSKIWKKIIDDVDENKKHLPGAFVRYDDTPRRGKNSAIVLNDTPDLFRDYMKQLLNKANKANKKFIFITAWNEWGEGAYLEPDEETEYLYLEALKCAIDSVENRYDEKYTDI